MDMRNSLWTALVMASLVALGSALSLPAKRSLPPLQTQQLENTLAEGSEEEEHPQNERATWLDTRDLEGNFKLLTLNALTELVRDGAVNPDVLRGPVTPGKKDKRGRWQGFCFRRTRTGRFLPYICWKGGQGKK